MSKSEDPSSGLAKSAATVSIAILLSRVLGLVREQVFAVFFGAGYAYDAFVVAFRIPNLLRDLFGEGALSAAFVAVFSDYNANRSAQETWRLASRVLCFFAIALSVLVLLGCLFAEQIVSVLAPDFGIVPGKLALTETMTVIMMPFLLFISLAAVVMGMLNTKGRFFVPALASSFFNLGSIIGGVSLAYLLPHYGYQPIIGMAFGTLIGGLLQLTIQLPALRKTGFRFSPTLQFNDPGLIRILKLMIPATIGLSATQINIFINTNFAASCIEGSVSWLNYAFRLVQLPIGLFGVAISIAALPLLARHASQGKQVELRRTFVSSLTLVFMLTIPATVGLVILAEPIIAILFEHGAFTALDTKATAIALSLYAVGLFAYSANKVIVPVYYAINATRYPVMASFAAIAVNISIILLTIDHFQHRAIAFSTSITMIVNFLFLALILYWKLGGYPLGYLVTNTLKIAVAAVVMGGVLYACDAIATPFAGQYSLIVQIVTLLALIAGAALFYVGLLRLFNIPELATMLDSAQRLWLRLTGRR
ncbi:murein biosynthesis integral membrane protein MurJ [Desulfofustis limnaeus]|uniref:Probable lipid II flippase MurJ n=1 Tax=Desulfofustis limnaeus TaxID=2740163 RepID=A0ABN6M308_9BACT|nr:murein biosynthesis integral membrane protein MurJ [Desulfofustis limnaeus]MDX9894193.1 murein biosynthesis integral membrane protein MurJ [Desulfofustis sp.]BDD87278.1 putative lipid II flippase MurJ [Desulfofustis limnaeus]